MALGEYTDRGKGRAGKTSWATIVMTQVRDDENLDMYGSGESREKCSA